MHQLDVTYVCPFLKLKVLLDFGKLLLKNTKVKTLLCFHDYYIIHFGNSRPEVFCKNMFLEISQNSQENTSARVSYLQASACNFIKKGTLAQVFSCEFCKISKNTFFHRTASVAASACEKDSPEAATREVL